MENLCFIAPYPELGKLAVDVGWELECPLSVFIGRMRQGVELARRSVAEGAQVVISRGVTAELIARSGIDVPVVEVPITGYDLLRAYYEAKEFGGRIGIVDVEKVVRGVRSLEKIIGEEFLKYVIKGQDEIEPGIVELRNQGAETIIGKIAMVRTAESYGMKGVIITSGREAVIQAVEEAQRVFEIRTAEQRKAEQMRAIVDFMDNGIIAVDEEGKITVFNSVAEKLSGWKAEDAVGRSVKEVIPGAVWDRAWKGGRPRSGEIVEIGNHLVVVNLVPISVRDRVVGLVVTFQETAEIQRKERRIRRRLAARGHVAKYTFDDILGEHEAMRDAVAKAWRYGRVESTVLINAETGTGKEMFAHAMHQVSPRKEGPFIAVNCAALPENLLESELFGYADGAFTGARKGGKPGVFELAHGGTIFLDEIGEMSAQVQARLLRVLEENEIMRLGDDRIIPVDVRVISATNSDLQKMVEEQKFRQDLYFRLNVLNLVIPPLRERKTDIPLLSGAFMDECARRFGKRVEAIEPEGLEILKSYHWPGNVRELRNVVERLVLLADEPAIRASLVRENLTYPHLGGGLPRKQEENVQEDSSGLLERIEKSVIEKVLAEVGGNKSEAARRLGIGRTTLWRKLNK